MTSSGRSRKGFLWERCLRRGPEGGWDLTGQVGREEWGTLREQGGALWGGGALFTRRRPARLKQRVRDCTVRGGLRLAEPTLGPEVYVKEFGLSTECSGKSSDGEKQWGSGDGIRFSFCIVYLTGQRADNG